MDGDLSTAQAHKTDEGEWMLTTTDNPFDPFTQYMDWYGYDLHAGYHTPSYLARVVVTSEALSEADQRVAINQAIDEIVRENVLGIYKKVTRTKSSVVAG